MFKLVIIKNEDGSELAQLVRDSDGAFIPTDELNNDYQEYLSWRAKGNEPDVKEAKV